MREIHNRALKEWAVVCEAMNIGVQTVLIRKGGIREEEGIFRVDDSEFFLLPTYDHQTDQLLRPECVWMLDRVGRTDPDPSATTISTYAVVDTVAQVADESVLASLDPQLIWNDAYLQQRLDFNPYDPLYVILLRVYRLAAPATVPMRPQYLGCKSWVTLEDSLSTTGAAPVLEDAEYRRRREYVLRHLAHSSV